MNTDQMNIYNLCMYSHPAAVSIIALHRHWPFSKGHRVARDELAFSLFQQSDVRTAQQREAQRTHSLPLLKDFIFFFAGKTSLLCPKVLTNIPPPNEDRLPYVYQ